jgi:hypothetical protein
VANGVTLIVPFVDWERKEARDILGVHKNEKGNGLPGLVWAAI